MELKKYLLKMIKKVKDPETIIKIYLKVKEIVGGQDEKYN